MKFGGNAFILHPSPVSVKLKAQGFMASNSSSAVLGLLVLLQLAGLLALALGSIYFLYCLGRAAAGIDRLADVAEAWLVWQQSSAAQPQTAPPTRGGPPPPPPPSSGISIEKTEAASGESFNFPASNRGDNSPL